MVKNLVKRMEIKEIRKTRNYPLQRYILGVIAHTIT